jgi:DeoR family fructose operon transcriptional repressor
MYAPERHQQILETARAFGRVDVASLARDLSATPEPVRRKLTAVTHSLPVANAVVNRSNITLKLLGGVVRGRTLAAVGGWTRSQVAEIFADVAFMGSSGISVERGLTTPDIAEATVKRALMNAARRTVVLVDHTRFGREDFASVAPLSDVDTIITDLQLSADYADDIDKAGPRVVMV